MKIFIQSLLLLSLVLFFACGEDPKKENEANLIGTWIAIQRTYSGCEDPNNNQIEDLSCSAADCFKLTFISDSLGRIYYTEEIVSSVETGTTGTFSVSEKKITLCIEEDENTTTCQSLKLDVSKNSLVLTESETTLNCTLTTQFIREAL